MFKCPKKYPWFTHVGGNLGFSLLSMNFKLCHLYIHIRSPTVVDLISSPAISFEMIFFLYRVCLVIMGLHLTQVYSPLCSAFNFFMSSMYYRIYICIDSIVTPIQHIIWVCFQTPNSYSLCPISYKSFQWTLTFVFNLWPIDIDDLDHVLCTIRPNSLLYQVYYLYMMSSYCMKYFFFQI